MTLVPFHHDGSTVRAAVRNGEPLFLLAGVCAALDLGDPDHAAEHLAPEARRVIELDHSGPMRQVAALTESGVLALALRAEGRRGRTNKAWLLEEVLPAARQLAGLGSAAARTIDTTATSATPAAGVREPLTPLALPAPEPQTGPVGMTGQSAAAGSLLPFDFEGRPVRIVTRAGDPWFVLADVCRVLEISEAHRAGSRLDDEDKGRHTVTTPGGDQDMAVVNESGLYALVLTSRKAEAKRFKRWLTSEVIPSIRRTGGYMVARPDETPEQVLARALLLAKETMDRATAQVAVMAPKVAALERIEGAEGSMSITDAGKVLGLGQKATFALLREHGWLFKRSGGQTWLGYQHQVTAGLLDHRVTTETRNGRATVHRQVLVTPKGLTALARLMADGREAA